MKQKLVFVAMLIAFAIASQNAFSQSRRVTGVVRSAQDSTTIPGVNIFVVSAPSIGTATNIDGRFEIQVPQDAKLLRFTFVGIVTQDVNIEGKSNVNVVMKPETMDLEEVVVVGYGIQRKEALTSAVSKVETKNIKAVSESSIEKTLQGNAAGVMVTSSRGIPGAAPVVQVRGATSINAGTEPLYVIDGIPVVSGTTGASQSFSALSFINPNDIKSISILKDAGAAAIYGSRAANGVVIIETKSGGEGKTKFDVTIEKGLSSVINNGFRMLNSSELLELQREAVENSAKYYNNPATYDWTNPASNYYLPDELANTNTDWWDEVTRTGVMANYNVAASGGTKNNRFYISGGYHENQGAIMNYDFNRYTGNAKFDHISLNEKFKVGSKFTGAYSKQNFVYDNSGGVLPWENPIFAAMAIPPYYAPFNPDGTVNFDLHGSHGNYNPYGIQEYQDQFQEYSRLINTTYLGYKFIPSLEFTSTFGLDYGYTKSTDWEDPRAPIFAGGEGEYSELHEYDLKMTTSNVLNFSKVFADKHSVTVTLGQEASREGYSYISGGGKGATYQMPYLSTTVADGQSISGHPSEITSTSLFAFASYGFNSRYYLQASIRRDGSSVFGKDNKYGNFGSVSGSWRINQEPFFNVDFINDLKLRASYGSTGNSSIGWYASKGNYFVATYNGGSSLLPSTIENPDLRWEKKSTADVALDFGVLGNRITGTIEYYNSKTTDLLLSKLLSFTSGFGAVLSNVGSLRNTGIELTLQTQNVKGVVEWTTSLNMSFPRSEVISLGADEFVGTNIRYRVGGKFQEYWLKKYAGVCPANGMPMWYDANGNITFNYGEAARYNVGDPNPDFFGSITNNIAWKGLSLDFMFYFMYGNEIMFTDRHYAEHDGGTWGDNANANQLRRWQKPGDVTDTPKPLVSNATGSADWNTSRWVDDGSYLRLKFVTLAYSLPQSLLGKAKLSKVTLYAKGTNLWTRAHVNGLDVERGIDGSGSYRYPNTKSFSFGVDISF